MSILSLISGVLVNLAVSAVIVGGGLWGFYAYYRRPKFNVGMPPMKSEQNPVGFIARTQIQIGRKSVISEFKHNKKCLAQRLLLDKSKLTARDLTALLNDKRRTRRLDIGRGNRLRVPILLENCGKRAASTYQLSIDVLSPDLHIVDIITETAATRAFYPVKIVPTRNSILKSKGKNDKTKAVNRKIISVYDDYMNLDDQYGDRIFLKGELEAGNYEIAIIVLKVEGRPKHLVAADGGRGFVIEYTVDCSESLVSRSVFLQGFVIRNMSS